MYALFPRKNTPFNQASARNGNDLEAGNNNEAAIGDGNDTKTLQIFTVQFHAQGSGSPSEAVMLADSLNIHLWGPKYNTPGWFREAQRIAHREKSWEEHTSELQSLMHIPYAVICLQKQTQKN